jgi:rod shape-determining protein MreC
MGSKKKKTRKKIWTVTIAILVASFLHVSGIAKPITNPIIRLANSVGLPLFSRGNSFRAGWDNRDVDPVVRVKELEEQVSLLEAENAKAKILEQENEELRGQLDFSQQNGVKALPARISARDSVFGLDSNEQSFVIDKGSKDGVVPGLAVTNQQGAILGKTVAVGDTSSTMCLSVSSNCQFPVTLTNINKTVGLTDGNLGLTIKMNYIPQSELISIGDYVVTSGLGGKMPRGLLIGKVSQVNSQSNEVWQEVTIEPAANIDNSTIVSVIVP